LDENVSTTKPVVKLGLSHEQVEGLVAATAAALGEPVLEGLALWRWLRCEGFVGGHDDGECACGLPLHQHGGLVIQHKGEAWWSYYWAIRFLGAKRVAGLVEEVLRAKALVDSEAPFVLLVRDKSRARTLGGVFFVLAKAALGPRWYTVMAKARESHARRWLKKLARVLAFACAADDYPTADAVQALLAVHRSAKVSLPPYRGATATLCSGNGAGAGCGNALPCPDHGGLPVLLKHVVAHDEQGAPCFAPAFLAGMTPEQCQEWARRFNGPEGDAAAQAVINDPATPPAVAALGRAFEAAGQRRSVAGPAFDHAAHARGYDLEAMTAKQVVECLNDTTPGATEPAVAVDESTIRLPYVPTVRMNTGGQVGTAPIRPRRVSYDPRSGRAQPIVEVIPARRKPGGAS
jgi:hypothetical protein